MQEQTNVKNGLDTLLGDGLGLPPRVSSWLLPWGSPAGRSCAPVRAPSRPLAAARLAGPPAPARALMPRPSQTAIPAPSLQTTTADLDQLMQEGIREVLGGSQGSLLPIPSLPGRWLRLRLERDRRYGACPHSSTPPARPSSFSSPRVTCRGRRAAHRGPARPPAAGRP